jgi:hypothetical protein
MWLYSPRGLVGAALIAVASLGFCFYVSNLENYDAYISCASLFQGVPLFCHLEMRVRVK